MNQARRAAFGALRIGGGRLRPRRGSLHNGADLWRAVWSDSAGEMTVAMTEARAGQATQGERKHRRFPLALIIAAVILFFQVAYLLFVGIADLFQLGVLGSEPTGDFIAGGTLTSEGILLVSRWVCPGFRSAGPRCAGRPVPQTEMGLGGLP